METKRLKRIKPQPNPVRRLPWRRKRGLPPRPENEHEEVTALLSQFARAGRFRAPLIPKKTANALSVILSVAITSVTLPILPIPVPLFILGWLAILLLVKLFLMCLTTADRQLWTSRQLSGSDDLRAIPALTRVLRWPEAGARTAAAIALARLLPCLQETDAAILDTATRSRLYRQLARRKTQRNQDLVLAILKALERSGDRSAYQYVHNLAYRRACSEPEICIQQAARACLPHLNAPIEQAQESRPLPHLIDTISRLETSVHPTPEQADETQETLSHAGLANHH